MAINNFQEFDTNKLNIQTDAEYTAESQRLNGVSGIAKSKMHNKLLRQVSVMVTAIGEFIKGTGSDATDTSVSTLLSAISNAFATKASVDQKSIFDTAGGTATAITLATAALTDKYSTTFIAASNNSGAATTINTKPLYKPGGATAPTLIAGKAYTIWYSVSGGCFFVKASAEGTAGVGDVLAPKTFSNDNDANLTGTMVERGTVNHSLPINGTYTIQAGHYNAGSVTQSITAKAAATYQPSTAAQSIAAGQYLSGAQTIAATTGTTNVGQVLAGYTFNSGYGIGLTGTIPIVNPDYADQTAALGVSVGAFSGDGANYAYLNHGLSGKYSNGANVVRRYEPYLRPEYILNSASIMGVNGTAVAGKRFASGTVTSTPTNSGYYVGPGGVGTNLPNITVSGLTFLPSLIVIIRLGLNITDNVIYSTDGIGLSTNTAMKIVLHRYSYAAYQSQSNLVGMFGVSDSAYITSTGFNLPVITASANHIYYAVE